MAFTQVQLNNLEEAIAEGVTSVQLNGRQVQYRSLEDMERLRDSIRAELGVSPSFNTRSRVINIAGGKGL